MNDGSWHSVFLELNRNFTSLSLDDSYVERRRAPLYFQTLSAESTIYLGALVQAESVRGLADARAPQAPGGFQGCLDSVVLNGHELPLQNKRSSFAEVVGLTELRLGCVLYPDACARGPCQHGGSCAGLPSGGECWPRAPRRPGQGRAEGWGDRPSGPRSRRRGLPRSSPSQAPASIQEASGASDSPWGTESSAGTASGTVNTFATSRRQGSSRHPREPKDAITAAPSLAHPTLAQASAARRNRASL